MFGSLIAIIKLALYYIALVHALFFLLALAVYFLLTMSPTWNKSRTMSNWQYLKLELLARLSVSL